MMIIENDYNSLNNISCDVADITKIITYNTVLRKVCSARQMAYRYLLVFCTGEEIWCFDYSSALELEVLRKYQSAPPCTSEMEDKHML